METGLIGINKYATFLNFACDIHAFAFQKYLDKKGYPSTFLDYRPTHVGDIDMRHPAKWAEDSYRRAVAKNLPESDLQRRAEIAMGFRSVLKEREIRFDKFREFERKNIRFTEEKYDSDSLEVKDPGFDCYVCVTDVIWQSIAKFTFDRGFLLGSKAFEGKSKISYAASRGNGKDFNEKESDLFSTYLGDIDSISIRERDFAEYIEENFGVTPEIVIDPVLLHDKEFWQGVTVPPKEEKYVLLYYVMEQSTDTIAKAVEYAKLHDLTLVELSDRPFKYGKVTDPDVKHIARYDVGPDEWLGYIESAECVLTNSFHGCCFSVMFERPFFVGKRNGQKVPNFLATFDLSDRQFTPDMSVADFPETIDYSGTARALRKYRRQSEKFILGSLKAAKRRVAQNGVIDHSPFDDRRRALKYPANFNSGAVLASELTLTDRTSVKSKKVPSGAVEYNYPGYRYVNTGDTRLSRNLFQAPGKRLAGWTLRFRVDNRWFWCLEDGSIALAEDVEAGGLPPKVVIQDEGAVPHMPVNHISVAVFTAEWEEDQA